MTADEPVARAAKPRASWTTGLLLSAGSLLFTLLLVEGGLRAAGFHYSLAPTVQFGWPDPQTIQTNYASDPDLFWVTRDYRDKLRQARRTHPAIIFLGDSCTEFGHYPERTLEFLQAGHSALATGLPLATGGWTSEQGLVQLKRDVLPLRPKVVVIFYGWNDHWMALGPTDPDLHLERRFLWLAGHLRIAQAALKAKIGLAERNANTPNRVPAARYLQNLEQMADLARNAGIEPVLVTAPSNYVAGHEPEYLLRRHVRRLSDVIPLHQQYVQLTRDAARNSGAVLCDAAAEIAALPGSHDEYFKEDAIHFTDRGDQEVGRIVSGCIEQSVHNR